MAKVIPFKGVLYNTSRVDAGVVLAPPYDIITPEFQDELYRKSPYNIVRVDFGKEQPGDDEADNKYFRAKRYFETWIRDEILVVSRKPSFYAYEISYVINGEEKRLLGFLGLVKLEELGQGSIYPHECTYSKPKQDRLTLLRRCMANVSPIFSLYRSSDGKLFSLLTEITKSKPYIEATDSVGAIHRLWQVDEKMDIDVIKEEMEDKFIIIADGHHRYETALEFQKAMREKRALSANDEPYDYILMFLTNMLDRGLTILPTHRLVKEIPDGINTKLSEYFEIEKMINNFEISDKISDGKHVFGFFKNQDKFWYL
ncbi:MAG: DUF1015 domain-containing protein, partial [Nitrospirota bacterium]